VGPVQTPLSGVVPQVDSIGRDPEIFQMELIQ